MAFASIFVPGFIVQAAVRSEPALWGRALAIVDGVPPLEEVMAASEAALRAGVAPGMPKVQAERFPGVEVRRRVLAHEESAHAAMLDLGWSISPRIEDAGPDTILLDIEGLGSLFGSEAEIASLLTRRASGLGLTVQVGVAANLEASLHAAQGFPGVTVIAPGEEARRLDPLPVRVLAPEPGILETLEHWGVLTCGALAALPLLDLSERLGQAGVQLHEQARGASVRSLVLAEPGLNFEEKLGLESAVADLEPLSFLLGRLLDQVCARLEARAMAAGAIRVRFRLESWAEEDFRTMEENAKPRRKKGSSNQQRRSYEKTLTLPVPMRDSKMLLRLLRLQLQGDPPAAAILAISLAADPAWPRATQHGLFLPSSPDPQKLELTLARLANLVGNGNIGSPRLLDTHRPDAFQMCRFTPPAPHDCAERRPRSSADTLASTAKKGTAITGFRKFRPAPTARVALRENRPVRVAFRGLRGAVIAASGPWRSSGDWWRKDGWQHDEWDLEIRFEAPTGDLPPGSAHQFMDGLYRFYYDAFERSWFVRGIYD